MHIAVLGLGPAGSVLAHRAVARGWTVDGYDPACRDTDGSPTLPEWRSTYGLPVAALPDWANSLIPFSSVSPGLSAHTPGHRVLDYGGYGMVDRTALRERLAPGIRLHRRRVDAPTARTLGVGRLRVVPSRSLSPWEGGGERGAHPHDRVSSHTGPRCGT